MTKKITHAQVLDVAAVLGLDTAYLQEVRITVDEVEVTYFDAEATDHGGPICHQVRTYTIDKTTEETR